MNITPEQSWTKMGTDYDEYFKGSLVLVNGRNEKVKVTFELPISLNNQSDPTATYIDWVWCQNEEGVNTNLKELGLTQPVTVKNENDKVD